MPMNSTGFGKQIKGGLGGKKPPKKPKGGRK